LLERLGLIGATDALLGQYEQDLGDTRRIGEILVAHGLVTEEQVADALRLQRGPGGAPDGPVTDRFDATGAWTRRRRNLQSLVLFAVAMLGVLIVTSVSGGGGSWYALGALSLLGVKLVGSARYRPARSPAPAGMRVAVVVCLYNEDPEAFRRCLVSIAGQTRAPDEVWVIDDGSPDEVCLRLAGELLEGAAGAVVHRLEHNGGKRHAQRVAFERTTCEIVMTLDSDTELDGAAIAEGLRPFADPRVNAVTGNVRALNYDRNVLTRLIDLRYAYAFLFERAAYSTVGSVVCCCGSLSFYRTALVRRHLADFVGQTFLGVPVQFGDDRRLTQYALQSGRAVLQDTAVGYTLVPERIGHFRRQQLRWNKSFFRETLWTLRRSGLRCWPFWISLVELTIWIASAASLINTVYVRPLVSGQLMPWQYAAYAALLAYARNVRYLGRPRASIRSQIVTFALAPLYSVLHVVLLTPLRLYALLTLRRSHWGTRARVEVHA
jgi:hyaluronan synthase